MKLLVLAQTPPPYHGQSIMAQTLVAGLAAHGVPFHHLNLQLSTDAADIGRWRPGKILRTGRAALTAIAARFRHGCDTLYYIPAPPGKRGALYRDWLILALCRPFYRRLVLHWHAAGLARWLDETATVPERIVSHRLLGRASLALVLSARLRDDGERLHARKIVVVPNGVPAPAASLPPPPAGPFTLVFLGLGSADKGLFAAAAAVVAANRETAAAAAAPNFRLVAAGPFAEETAREEWQRRAAQHPAMLHHVGVVDAAGRRDLLAGAHALGLPTRYAAEAFPLVALEALAHDRPVLATAWRGLPDIVTPDTGRLTPPGDDAALVAALLDLARHPPLPGVCRARYEADFTVARHLSMVVAALREL